MTRSFVAATGRDEIVPPPLDTHIPTDDELDALCDELMRFDAAIEVGADAPSPKTPIK